MRLPRAAKAAWTQESVSSYSNLKIFFIYAPDGGSTIECYLSFKHAVISQMVSFVKDGTQHPRSRLTRSGMVFLRAGSRWLDRQDISPREKRLKLLMTVLDNNSIPLNRKAKL